MKRSLLVALMILVSLLGMVGFSCAGNTVSALQATANPTTAAVVTLPATGNAVAPPKHKMYYVTFTTLTGGKALTACDSGFHMARISEIQNPSTLQYDTDRIPQYEAPPVGVESRPSPNHMGWIRTGDEPTRWFQDNCDFWNSSSARQSGTVVEHYSITGDASLDLTMSDPTTWWHATLAPCSLPKPVWCVEDPE